MENPGKTARSSSNYGCGERQGEWQRRGGATKVVNDSSSSSNLNKGQRGGRQRTGAWRVGVRATWPQKVEAQLTRCCRVTSATVASGFSAEPGLAVRLDWIWLGVWVWLWLWLRVLACAPCLVSERPERILISQRCRFSERKSRTGRGSRSRAACRAA